MARRFTIFFALVSTALFSVAVPSMGHQVDGSPARQATGLIAQLAEPNVRAGSTAWGAAANGVPQPSPRPECGPGSRPETGMQGRVPAGSTAGFTCNTELVGRHGMAGGYKVLRYTDSAGHECAYYDNTLLFPNNARSLSSDPTGVTVLDMSNPAKPVRTATLSTPAMQSPHESLVLNERRGLLAAVLGNPAFYPGVVDIYDLSADCRFPVVQSSLPVGVLGHESGFAPDGNTFYATSISTGQVTAVDVSNPKLPRPLAIGEYKSHGLTISDDGNRGYVAGSGGLVIIDLSEIQARKPNPQMREISRLDWSTRTIPQVALPVTIAGKPYLVEIDEFSKGEDGQVSGNGSRVGAGRIISIENERAPRVVSDFRLAVHQPENRKALAGDPGTDSPVQGYAGHYCSVPRRNDPGIVACSFIASGMRVFDIRDPEQPKELAYFVAPEGSSATVGAPSNYAMSAPAFVPERREIWYSDGNTGFYAIRVAQGVWPFGKRDAGGPSGRGCLTRTPRISRSRVGRVRLGATRRALLGRAGARPTRRTRNVYRWCVKGSRGRVTALFSRRGSRGRSSLVIGTARTHRVRRVGPGTSKKVLLRRFPRARRLSRELYRAAPRSPVIFGVRRGRVRFVGVASARLLRSGRKARAQLRRAGF